MSSVFICCGLVHADQDKPFSVIALSSILLSLLNLTSPIVLMTICHGVK